MEEKRNEDFTLMNKFICFCMLAFLGLGSCNDNTGGGGAFIPDVPVNITINTQLPLYFHLQNLGGYALINGGSRGIFLVHGFDDTYYALERTCTYLSDLTCSVIQIDSQNIQLKCGTYSQGAYSECCKSKFSFDGNVLESPSTYPLKRYVVTDNDGVLYIRN
ncbi:MAG: nitrite reductase/ring-hydroxylating ferredoxin subunit [Bacteroidia bacterium]|jgi:nitrite reductase/ring-hydroxylating ferredoxin subunit